ncbi:MAG: FGGY-family carbohydrate kinase, partial [Pseudomonadota bacterium]|nr:FGGY-family carbohydrate kinase [Pseudomonadota bacterium]
RKRPFGQISRPLSLNSAAIRLKCTKNLTQNGVPSLRPLFSDSLLESVDLEHAFSKPFSDTIFINGIGGLGSPFWKSLNSGFWSISRECMIEDMQTIDDNLQGLVAESILFLIQANIDAMLQQGRGFQQLTITGGIARSDGFCQRLADLSGMEVVRPHIVEATARGIASEAAGEYGQWSNSIPDKFYPQHDVLLNKRYRTFLTLI